MGPRVCLAILCVTITFAIGACREQQVTVSDASLLLDSLEHKIDWVEYRLAGESWKGLTTGRSDSLEYFCQLHDWIISDKNSFDRMRSVKQRLRDETDQRRAALLFPGLLQARVEMSDQVRVIKDSLLYLIRSHQFDFDGQPRSRTYLENKHSLDESRTDRELAYRALNALGENTADLMSRLFRLRNQKARQLGYNDFIGMQLGQSELAVDEYLKLLQRLDSVTASPYVQMTDQIRRNRSTVEIEIWDLPYEYSSIFPAVDRYFPVDSQIAYLRRGFEDLGFDLDDLPIYFEFKHATVETPAALALELRPPVDQRVVLSQAAGLSAAATMAEQIGSAVRASFVNQPQALFTRLHGSVWSGCTARMFSQVIESEEWLGTYAHLPAELVGRYSDAKSRRDLVELRMTLLRLKFEYEAYRNPNKDLNRLYWDLFEDYLLLPRHDEISPWAATLEYVTHPGKSHTWLLADIVAAQTLSYLERNNDSVIGNPETKAFLVQNYFRFGSRFPWKELLERGTGEPLQPSYYLDRLGL